MNRFRIVRDSRGDCLIYEITDRRVSELLRRIYPHSRRLHPDVECASRRILTREEINDYSA